MEILQGSKKKCGAEPSHVDAPARLDLEQVRERLQEKRGPELWRSLDELAETPEFQDFLHREFPRHASEWQWGDGVSRRSFLQLASASLALAGLTACTRQPEEKIVPYVKQPEQIVPGRPLFFSTAVTLGGYAMGVLAESQMGRPIKIEGNPRHPASLGATDAYTQAAVLNLYDPERSQSLNHFGRMDTWEGFVSELNANLQALLPLGGEGLRLLTGTVTSPSLAASIQDILRRFPRARWHRWEAAGDHHTRKATASAFGRPVDCVYDFRRADVVVSLDSDVLTNGPGNVRYQRDFSERRRVRANRKEMNRLYAVESQISNTGTVADHRLQLSPVEVEAFALALAAELGVAAPAPGAAVTDAKTRTWVTTIAKDLQAHRGTSLVVADEHASPALQILAHGINQALGNVGSTVAVIEPVEADPVDHVASITELARDMNAGRVQTLVILDGVNPVYTAPVDLDFAQALQKVPLRIHHGLYQDETAEYCHWHIPAAHELESWGDARSFDGTVTLIQPLIEPLYEGKTALEVLAAFSGRTDATSYELVQQFWQGKIQGGAPEAGTGVVLTSSPDPDSAGSNATTTAAAQGNASTGATPATAATQGTAGAGAQPAAAAGGVDSGWRHALHSGVVPNTAAPRTGAAVNGGAVQQAAADIARAVAEARGAADRLTLLLRPDPTIYDGRFASNTWLQELPKPTTKLTWDNALLVAPATAQRLKLRHEETAEIEVEGRKLRTAVWVQPGMAENTALITLGYGRSRAGEIGSNHGFNAYAVRTSAGLWRHPGLQIRPLGERYVLASTQNHHLLESGAEEVPLASEEAQRRHVVRTGTLAEFIENPDFLKAEREAPEPGMTMYPPYKYEGHAWAMAIDLNVCTGCSACVVACQAENNIPVVGKQQVLAGREMHWLRIDRYFAGDMDEPVAHFQPVPCMHCENAPCEVVCPVAATVHSDEGLNDMVYNRCVGTRYCSNNCPYKVRRFNFFRYSDKSTPVMALLYNPDVTVRMRGVMEKCTYCVQRIEQAKIESKVDGEPIPVNRLQTACQQACPTQAIVFGDQNDPEWQVSQMKADPLNYGLLEEINTRPRTTYLAKLRNSVPELEALSAGAQPTAAERKEHGHA
ncbi:MAG TPA: TAT-variant-translocated molybdopterin oxidoreductase [Thermoanaerobaculia bacterium]|nr:TAT-variant-translocated molybdopterin oxidoreductase [Thermoanaerobaculia bacterium]